MHNTISFNTALNIYYNMHRQPSIRQINSDASRGWPVTLVSSVLVATLMACKPSTEEKPNPALAVQTSETVLRTKASSHEPNRKPLRQKAFRIGIIGDSITHGVYFRNRYPDTLERLLQRRFPGSVVDPYGIKGQTTRKLRARFRRNILAHKPSYDTVIIQGGTNDLYIGYRVKRIQRNLTYMIEAAKKKGMKVVLVTVGPCHNYSGWNAKKEERKKELNRWILNYPGVTVVDTQSVLSEGNPPVMRQKFFHKDYIHPNADGLDAIARKIAESIATTP
jgi:lysophospholipase L1-like esterase